jgi:hypothetical protein
VGNALNATDLLNAFFGSSAIATAQVMDVLSKGGNVDLSTASPFQGAPNAMATGGAVIGVVTSGVRWIMERNEGFTTSPNPIIKHILTQNISSTAPQGDRAHWQKYKTASDQPSPLTRNYLRARSNKDFAGAVSSSVGGAAAPASQVNIPGLVKNVSSLTTTSIHIHKLKYLRNKLDKDSRAREALKHVLSEKAVKAGARSGATLADAIPAGVPAAGAVVGAATGLATSAMKAISSEKCEKTAKLLHFLGWYFINMEAGLSGWQSPGFQSNDGYQATRILRELLTQRGISAVGKWIPAGKVSTELHGRAKAAEYMAEPAGWMVIHDKLSSL